MNRPVDPEIRRKLNKFNQWEAEFNQRKSREQSYQEFCHLYELIFELKPEQQESAHQKHLEHLVEMSKRLKPALSKVEAIKDKKRHKGTKEQRHKGVRKKVKKATW